VHCLRQCAHPNAAPGAFDAATSYGVMGMRERARHLGGHIALSSAPGAGCRVLLRVPLPAEAARPALPETLT
jgi:glucose-6-phosphate-specific signal transduction histidine kinase